MGKRGGALESGRRSLQRRASAGQVDGRTDGRERETSRVCVLPGNDAIDSVTVGAGLNSEGILFV